MLLIYTSQISTRLEFILKVIFQEVLGIQYQLTSDIKSFTLSSEKKIVYGEKAIENSIHIIPSGLLEQTGVSNQEISIGKWGDLPVIFSNKNKQIPFDLFSAAFYMVTRYEEYMPFEGDTYGRFPAEKSIAFRKGFLRLPIVDLWSIQLASLLKITKSCPAIQPENYKFQLTVDIDQAWLYRNKGFFYSIGAILRDQLKFKFKESFRRISALMHLSPDPGNTFDYLLEAQEKLDSPIHYFVLCRGRREYDKNRAIGTNNFRKLIQKLDLNKAVGIHPSFASNEEKNLLEEEIFFLKNLLGREIKTSRHHYLKFSFPETCRQLIKQGIKEDYTLGFSAHTGFRTGIARSYNFYDLKLEEETKLRLTPLIIMDRTLKDSLAYSTSQASQEFAIYSRQIKDVGGEFVCLWHNDALSDSGEWKGWRRVFENLIENQSAE